jgi:hypothetical protein
VGYQFLLACIDAGIEFWGHAFCVGFFFIFYHIIGI